MGLRSSQTTLISVNSIGRLAVFLVLTKHQVPVFRRQPLVPVISVADGRWLLDTPLNPTLKPGGHGAIWKLMWDEGVFRWLAQAGAQAALVRQISNPLAGTDTTMLALAGSGFEKRRAFGFMSCERAVGAAEGMNVLQEQQVSRGEGQGGRCPEVVGVCS